MPFNGHETFREIEVAAISAKQKSSQTVPFRKVFRVAEASVPATTIRPRDQYGSQVLYLPTPVSGTATGSILWTVYANVNGTVGTATEVGSYSVDTAGAVTYTGGIIGAAIGGASYTPTANNSVTALEIPITGVTVGNTHYAYIICEVFPYTPVEELINYRPVATAALTAAEPGTI